MLPEIKNLDTIHGYDKSVYSSSVLKWKLCKLHESEFEGVTNKTGVIVIRRINKILKESMPLGKLFFCFTKITDQLQDPDIRARLHITKGDERTLKANRIVQMRMAESIAKQRRMLRSYKAVISKNPIDSNWKKALDFSLKKMETRVDYLWETIIPASVEATPLEAYLLYLKENNRSLVEDADSLINRDASAAEEEDRKFMEHVLRIVEEYMATRPDFVEELNKRRAKAEESRMRSEETKERMETEKKEKLEEKARSALYSFSSVAEKRLRSVNKRSDSAAYVVLAVRVPGNNDTEIKPGFLRYRSAGLTSSDPRFAHLFKSEEEAMEYARERVSQAKNHYIYHIIRYTNDGKYYM